MNPPNTIASDTLVEAVARAMRPKLSECIALSLNGNPNKWKQAEEILTQAALTAIADAGYAVVPREPTDAMVEAGRDIHDFDDSLSDLANDYNLRNAAAIYRAMIQAAQGDGE